MMTWEIPGIPTASMGLPPSIPKLQKQTCEPDSGEMQQVPLKVAKLKVNPNRMF